MSNSIFDTRIADQYLISGTQDPTIVPTRGEIGTIFIRIGSNGGTAYQKQDSGETTNWTAIGGGGGGGISSINGETQAAQFIASNSSGTSPSIVSVGGTHFIQIPSASSVGVTEGTVSHSVWSAVDDNSSAPSRSVFVAIDGDPVSGNGSLLNPFLYIQSAIDYIESLGDTTNNWAIFIGPGDYSSQGGISISRPKTHLVGTVIGSADTKAVTIEAINIAPSAVFGSIANSVFTLSNLLINNAGAACVRLAGFNGCTLELNNVFCFNSGAFGRALWNNQSGLASRIFSTNCIFSSTASTGNAVEIEAGSFRSVNSRLYAGAGSALSITSGASSIIAVCELSSTGAVAVSVNAGSLAQSECTITSSAANATAVDLAAGGTLYSTSSGFNVPVGTGFAVRGVLGCVYYNATNVYVQNPKVSAAMGAGVVNLQTAYVLA